MQSPECNGVIADSSKTFYFTLMKEKVIIMGAGIQGICCALALADSCNEIILIDKTPEPLLRSGLRNEGKIHMGFVYANDPGFRTASLMLQSALQFAPLIETFIGRPVDWIPLRAKKFSYLILNDTMVAEDKILQHYARLQQEYNQIKSGSLHYMGVQLDSIWEDSYNQPPIINFDRIQRCIPTEEVAIDLVKFRDLLLGEIAKRSNIHFLGNCDIKSIEQTTYGYTIQGLNGDQKAWTKESSTVINCLWENRLYFDKQLGISPQKKWVYRLKHRILGKASANIAALDSYTFVLGAFGDIVNYSDESTYLSWYPACMSGWSTDLTTPQSWEDACNGKMVLENNRDWVNKALVELDTYFPGMKDFEVNQIDGGIIFSWGKTDIVDNESELHQRFNIGIHQQEGYFSIDTGKFTSAPLFAQELKQLLFA